MEEPQENVTVPKPAPKTSTLRDALLGFAALNQNVSLFNYADVLVRKDYKQMMSVRIISGGHAGHELEYAEFVGKGFLTAVVYGDVYQAPSARLILRIIQELTANHQDGALVIVPADKASFSFGLAVEYARIICTRVRILCVDDVKSADQALVSSGSLLISKIAGAMSEQGCTYDEVWELCEKATSQVFTVSLDLSQVVTDSSKLDVMQGCTLLDENHFTFYDPSFDLQYFFDNSVVVVFNTYKELSKLILYNLVKKILVKLKELQISVAKFYVGRLVGVPAGKLSLTILNVFDSKVLTYLDYPCSVVGWSQMLQSIVPLSTTESEIPSGLVKLDEKSTVAEKGPKLTDMDSNALYLATNFACNALISCERQLDIIDAEKSRGNLGTRLRKACERVNRKLEQNKLPRNCPYVFLKKLGMILEAGIQGAMGSVYGMLCDSAAEVFGELPPESEVSSQTWLNALNHGISKIEKCCAQNQKRTTMYFPLKRYTHAVFKEVKKNEKLLNCLNVGVAVAEQSAQDTILPGHKYSDAGAHAVGIWMRAVFESIKLTYSVDE